ncbi:hypothetical protein NMY22_g12070 [Coprinellus aureogranulatus]|nr:hypothetical protein NMY22_g12070 [Coprinellus aureogranulatus]
MSTGAQPNETPRSSQHSSRSTTLSPPWQPPKTPLAPHRLAKLANALGVSAPIPASLNGTLGSPAFISRSFSESSGPPDTSRRSPTPSAASSMSHYSTQIPSTSKFLLHVIPPTHLPHDSDASNDFDMTPPPASASGYHTQFRRGTLVPVHPTLQGQLGAIAKEYALPSTTGLVLFLVSSGAGSGMQSPVSTGSKSTFDGEFHEPGPRLSEHIWRHLWTRVVQAEEREASMLLPPRSPTPLTLSSHTTPFLRQDFSDTLRPPPSPGLSPISPRPGHGFGGISSSPPESVSDSLRFNTKSAPPSTATQSEFHTADTSVDDLALDLPGLTSPSLIPILAKVEFDIDRRKAGWYEPWLRSRRANHAKRARSRKGSTKSTATEEASAEADKAKEKVPAIPLMLGRKETASPLGLDASDPSKASGDGEEEVPQENGYEPLSDTQEGESDFEDVEDDFTEESTARVSSVGESNSKDPLEDVFGSDADTWSDMKGERRGTHELNPNVVDLALNAGDLTAAPASVEEEDAPYATKEEDEVRDLLNRMSKGSAASTPELDARFSPPSKKVPPPLIIKPDTSAPNVVAAEPSPVPTTTRLAYLDTEKRSGALFEDIDLGLDPATDYDEDDPYDRRKSQIVMSAQLDAIERTLAQLSPRFMNTDLEDDMSPSFQSMATLSPNSQSTAALSPTRSEDPSLVSSQLPKPANALGDSQPGASWPAVPFSQIKDTSSSPPKSNSLDQIPGPPQLALNGVTTAAPPSFNLQTAGGETSAETVLRKKELEEEEALFRKPTTDSPIIPLSPDPIAEPPDGWDTTSVGQSSVVGDGEKGVGRMGRARSGTTSRFSVDSIPESEGSAAALAPAKSNRGTLMSVKSIKNLWRKSNKGDKAADKEKEKASGKLPPGGPPQRPERPSQETMDLPDVPPMPPSPSFGRISPQPGATPNMARRPSQDSTNMSRAPSSQGTRPSLDQRASPEPLPPRRSQDAPTPNPTMGAPGLAAPPYANIIRSSSPIIPTQMMGARQNYGLDRLQFDQESPYP